jgi:hypothetical protein
MDDLGMAGRLAVSVGVVLLSVGVVAARSGSADGSKHLCAPHQLRATAGLQGATGSQLGGVMLMNLGTARCVLPRRAPRVSLAWRGHRLSVHQIPFPKRWLDAEYPSGSSRLSVLRPGRRAYVVLQWWNWCGPRPWGNGYFPGVIQMELPGQARAIIAPLRESGTPYCNRPPSTLRVSGFLRPPR